jgi:NAD(P)H-flavin reductase
MAPLYAIAEEAVRQQHTGAITIYHGALAEDRFYLVSEFQELVARAPNLRYVRCVLSGQEAPGVVVGDLQQIVLGEASDVASRRFYLCGDPEMVRSLKRKLFLKGASLRRIHADPFVVSHVAGAVTPGT